MARETLATVHIIAMSVVTTRYRIFDIIAAPVAQRAAHPIEFLSLRNARTRAEMGRVVADLSTDASHNQPPVAPLWRCGSYLFRQGWVYAATGADK
jgi:hypothetical protein